MTVLKESYLSILKTWYIRDIRVALVSLVLAVFLLGAATLPSAGPEALSNNGIPQDQAGGMVPNPGGSPPCIPGPGVCP